MGVNPRDVSITREQVAGWLEEWYGSADDPKDLEALRAFLEDKIEGPVDVNTTGHENLGDQTPLIDLIMSDLESYAPAEP
jgi:hypothetical protein